MACTKTSLQPYLIFVADAADILRGEFSGHVEKFKIGNVELWRCEDWTYGDEEFELLYLQCQIYG